MRFNWDDDDWVADGWDRVFPDEEPVPEPARCSVDLADRPGYELDDPPDDPIHRIHRRDGAGRVLKAYGRTYLTPFEFFVAVAGPIVRPQPERATDERVGAAADRIRRILSSIGDEADGVAFLTMRAQHTLRRLEGAVSEIRGAVA